MKTSKLDQLIKNMHTQTSKQLDKRVYAMLDDQNLSLQNRTKPSLWRQTMNRPITRYVAAAITLSLVISGTILFNQSISPVYGITDAYEIDTQLRTIHMKGTCTYQFPDEQAVGIPVEVWIDFEKGRKRDNDLVTIKGQGIFKKQPKGDRMAMYLMGGQGITYNHSELISDGEYTMHLNHSAKAGYFTKNEVSDFQRHLTIHRHQRELLNLIYSHPAKLDNFQMVAEDNIEDKTVQVWELVTEIDKTQIWLSPDTGEVVRYKTISNMLNGHGKRIYEIHSIERDIDISEEVFEMDPPASYQFTNSKETVSTATFDPSAYFSAMDENGIYTYSAQILFELEQGGLILGWQYQDSDPNYSDKAIFESLTFGGPLPKLPITTYGIESIGSDDRVLNQFVGKHLIYTEKQGLRYVWGLYLPKSNISQGYGTSYKLLNRSNGFKREISGITIGPDLKIKNKKEFDLLVRGAMSQLSDEIDIPENVTYEKVIHLMELHRQKVIQ